MKSNIKFIVIGLIILIIPIGLIIKRAIAIEMQKEAIELCQFGDSRNDFDKAIEKINLAIKLTPANYLFYATKAQIFESQKKYRDAIKEFQKINNFKDNYAEGYVAIGLDYERLGYTDSSRVYYNYALKLYNSRVEKYSNDKERLYSERINRAYVYTLLKDSINSSLEYNRLKTDYPEYKVMIAKMESFGKKENFIPVK